MALQTVIEDDGSTLTFDPMTGYSYATPATDEGQNINAAVSGWSPQTFNPAASTYDDVLKLGIARTLDAITRPLELQNGQPVYQRPAFVRYNTGTAPSGAGAGAGAAVMLGLVAVLAWWALRGA